MNVTQVCVAGSCLFSYIFAPIGIASAIVNPTDLMHESKLMKNEIMIELESRIPIETRSKQKKKKMNRNLSIWPNAEEEFFAHVTSMYILY